MLESFVIIMRGSYWESVTVKTCMVALSSGAPSALVKGVLERMIRSCDHEEIPSSASPPSAPLHLTAAFGMRVGEGRPYSATGRASFPHSNRHFAASN